MLILLTKLNLNNAFSIYYRQAFKFIPIFFFTILVAHSAEEFNATSATLFIYNSNDYNQRKTYQDVAKHIVIVEGIMDLGSSAFERWDSLVTVKIGNSVYSIGDYAFSVCSNIENVTLGGYVQSIGISAFSSCKNMKTILIQENLTSIKNNAFRSCTSLINIIIPNSVTSIGSNVFYLCTSLQNIKVLKQNLYYTNYNNDGVLYNNIMNNLICYPAGSTNERFEIPSSITTISDYAFYNCSSLKNVEIPTGINYIGNYAFSYCSFLEKLQIPRTATSIGYIAFTSCSSLLLIEVDSLNQFYSNYNNDGIFYNYGETQLLCYPAGNPRESFQVPSTVTMIYTYAFQGSSFLKNIIIPNNVNSIQSCAFMNCISLKSIIIPSSVNTIAGSLFQECSSLTNITIPNSITQFERFSFSSCTSLESIEIPSNLTTIDIYAFSFCSSLKNITIPKSVSTIGQCAFEACTSLRFIDISSENLVYSNFENDGIVYDKNITKIICYPAGYLNTFYFPPSVSSIELYSFESCDFINFTIPNNIKSIGIYSFFNCSKLETIIIGENVTEILSGAFSSCICLKCIYYYGKSAPSIVSNAFTDVPAKSIMTTTSYENNNFGTFNVSKGIILDECLPPTSTFTQSQTYSQSNTFTKSNTFTSINEFESITSFSSGITITHSYILTRSISFTHTISIYSVTYSNSFTITFLHSKETYIDTLLLFYEYTFITYSFFGSFYSDFYTILYLTSSPPNENKTIIIIIVCVVVVIIVIVLIVITLMIIRNKKRMNDENDLNSIEENEIKNTNNFIAGMEIANSKEDPFADDFKEDNHIEQI